MLKHYSAFFGFLQRLTDFSLSFAIWMVLFHVRFNVLPNAEGGLALGFVGAGLVLGVVTVYFFSRASLYKSLRLSSKHQELVSVFKANSYAVLVFVVLLYFLADARLSRAVLLGYYVCSTLSFLFLKLSIRTVLWSFRKRGYNLRHVLLIGHGNAIEKYVMNIYAFKESGIVFAGWVDSNGLAEKYGIRECEYSGSTILSKLRPDSVIVSYHGEKSGNVDVILKDLHNDVVPVVVLPDLNYLFVGYHMDSMAGIPALVVNEPNFSILATLTKRAFDMIASGIGLIIISPALALIAIGVKFSSAGPIFFGQERIGLDGRHFKMWKFRSMKVGGEVSTSGVPGWTVKDDPRKTRFGMFIRATSLDELPQLWNVFVGDMSLVGPRPEQPYYVEKFRHEIPAYMLRHKVKAGITGWAQVNGWRGDTSLHKRIECDLYYIRNWSLWLDIKILFLTFWKGFVNKNAY